MRDLTGFRRARHPRYASPVEMLRTRTFLAAGASMYPFIPGGSRLTVKEYDGGPLSPGDVVGYVGAGGLIAHRVLSVAGQPPHGCVRVRGDAQQQSEELPVEAIAYVVLEVSYRGLHYRLGDPVGRLVARLALGGGLPVSAVRRLLRAARNFWPL